MQNPRSLHQLVVVFCLALFATLFGATRAEAQTKRPIGPDDFYRMREVGDPQVSPDGKWIAYTVRSVDRDADKRVSAIWLANWEGTQNLQITFGPDSASTPRWSGDGKYLSFISSRKDGKSQVWILDRRGGEAQPLTSVKEDIGAYAWSPDGKKLALQMSPADDEEDAADAGKPGEGSGKKKAKAPKPIVIDRYQFKADVEGYLTDASRSQLYLFDVETRKLEPLTTEKRYDDGQPYWSPDSTQIAYTSDHSSDPDQTDNFEIYVIDAKSGATPRKIAAGNAPGGQHLAWSPDGKQIAFLEGAELKYGAYNSNTLHVVSADGGTPLRLAQKLDQAIARPEFTADGTAITFSFGEDRRVYLARIAVNGGDVERLTDGSKVIFQRSTAAGHTAVSASDDATPGEIYALESGKLRRLTTQNDALLSEIKLGAVEDISAKSKDGNEVHAIMTKPPDYDPSKKYPTLLWIHGGPDMQDDHSLPFDLYPLQVERQMFAARGYVVLAVNYRGGSGRGAAYGRAIFADWGHKEVLDLLAAVDYVIAKGIADPNRLGVGGWSYGGMLTDYTIASDTRFKAAISGAGIGNELSMYGSDQYIRQYNNELGPPWKTTDLWLKVSYPFFHADRIKTPTLFMGGRADFNVPIGGGEQMYQALRTLGVPTQLVIYPEQFHIFTRPSYVHDRMERFLAWWDKYLKQ